MTGILVMLNTSTSRTYFVAGRDECGIPSGEHLGYVEYKYNSNLLYSWSRTSGIYHVTGILVMLDTSTSQTYFIAGRG